MIAYIIKVVFASGILYSYYWFFLRNKQFHQYNRFYLLGLVITVMILPVLKLPVQIFAGHEKTGTAIRLLQVSGMSWGDPVIITSGQGFWKIFFGLKFFSWFIYGIVVFILLILLVRSLIYIQRIIRKYPYQQVDDIQFFQTEEPGTPFSFFKRIFWDKKLDVYSTEGDQILRHELYHVRQGHSFDILFIEIINILFWFNPFFLLVKKELKAIHEFLADEFAISGDNRYAYAEILVWQSIRHKKTHLPNSFFSNQIKRRITMITNPKQRKIIF